jgi:phosphoglycolate phosphatase
MPRLTNRPRAILFDLDGTLTDPAPGITRCLTHAMVSLGLPVPPYGELLKAIGPPWEDYLPTMGIPEDQVGAAMEFYRDQYAGGGLFEATLYEGVVPMLAALKDRGFEIALATSKPIDTAARVVEHFGLLPYFDFLGAATLDGTRSHKEAVIRHVLDHLGHEDVAMVGDRMYDIVGARHHGIPCVSVRWGHAPEGELEDHNPAAIVSAAHEVVDLMLSLPVPADAPIAAR